jgi:hypothetical protein
VRRASSVSAGFAPFQIIGWLVPQVGWFNSMNIDTISLTIAGRDDVVLLVIPPRSSPAAAAALRMAAAGRSAVQSAAIFGVGVGVVAVVLVHPPAVAQPNAQVPEQHTEHGANNVF